MKEVALNVFIPKELKDKLKIECIKRDVTLKEFVAMALDFVVESGRGCDEKDT